MSRTPSGVLSVGMLISLLYEVCFQLNSHQLFCSRPPPPGIIIFSQPSITSFTQISIFLK